LYLCIGQDDEIVAFSDLHGPPMNPEQASEFILRPMVDYVFIRK
jgi:hypothetical protein